MNELPRQKLCELIGKYGESLCDEPLRLEGLLRDLCGEYRLEINLFVQALKEGIATDLRSASVAGHTDLLLVRLGKRLQDHYAVSEESARWVVESWALALRKIAQTDLTPEADISKPAAAVSHEPIRQPHRTTEPMVAARSSHQPVDQAPAAPITYARPKHGGGWIIVLIVVTAVCAGGVAAWYSKLVQFASYTIAPPVAETPAPGAPLSSQTTLATPDTRPPEKVWDRPHIYLQIANEAQRNRAIELSELLRKSGYTVMEIENVSGNEGIPRESSELRFFTPNDSTEAQRIANEVAPFFRNVGIFADLPVAMPHVSHARQYEIWFSSSFH